MLHWEVLCWHRICPWKLQLHQRNQESPAAQTVSEQTAIIFTASEKGSHVSTQAGWKIPVRYVNWRLHQHRAVRASWENMSGLPSASLTFSFHTETIARSAHICLVSAASLWHHSTKQLNIHLKWYKMTRIRMCIRNMLKSRLSLNSEAIGKRQNRNPQVFKHGEKAPWHLRFRAVWVSASHSNTGHVKGLPRAREPAVLRLWCPSEWGPALAECIAVRVFCFTGHCLHLFQGRQLKAPGMKVETFFLLTSWWVLSKQAGKATLPTATHSALVLEASLKKKKLVNNKPQNRVKLLRQVSITKVMS